MTKLGTALLASILALPLGALADAASATEAFMHTGGRTTQPVGHYEFCRRIPDECRETTPKQAPIPLTRKLWAEMVNINNTVNTMVTPRTDQDIWGKAEV